MADQTPLIDGRKQGKQGHRVLCLFDSRKATLIVNFIALALLILFFVLTAIVTPPDVWMIVVFIISVLFYVTVIIGACSFRYCAVLTALIWEVIVLVLNIIFVATYDWNAVPENNRTGTIVAFTVLFVWRLLVLYADGTFVHETRKGIMTKETRSREAYFCCCNV
jgi:hypothetical protein